MIWRVVFFFKQKTAYEMRISDWSSDVCSSDLCRAARVTGTTSSSVVMPSASCTRARMASAAKPICAAGARSRLSDHSHSAIDRKSVVSGKSVSVSVDLGGRRLIQIKKQKHINIIVHSNTQIQYTTLQVF